MVRDIPPMAGGILSYFARHRTVANLLLVVMVVAGLAAAPNMRAQFFPDVVVDDVTVSVVWDGAGAEDVDSAIVQPLESALLAVEGVASSVSNSREGRAQVRLEFEPDWDMSRAAEDVQSAVDQVTTLPAEAEEPRVQRGIWRDRVTDVVITGPVGVDQLARFADELVTRLFAEGITRTTVRGVAAPETLVEVTTVDLMAHDISIAEIAAIVAAEVTADPAGDVTGANARVRTGAGRTAPDQIAQIVLRSNPDGSVLRLSDVARIEKLGVDRERGYFVGGNPAMSVRVDRSASGDAIRAQRDVERVAAALQATLPAGVTVDLIRTRAEQITGRLDLLISNGLTGLALVVGLLFLFLNARTAFWVAAGIPVAMLAAIALMYAFGLTLNMISLFGLIITLGLVVDDAIVVGEHADARHRMGEPPVVAAENAARRMAMPVFAAMLTTVIAFYGLVVIGGRMGSLIADIPFTVIAVLAASLVECFLILPNHMAHALAHAAKVHWYDLPSRYVNRGFDWVRDRAFRPLIGLVVTARYPVLAGVILLLAVQVGSLIRGDVPWRFFNSPEQGSVTGNFSMLPGASRADTIEMMQAMQRAAEEVAARYEAEHGRNPIDYMIAEIGGNAGRSLPGAEDTEADLLGGLSIEMIDPDLRPYSSFAFVADLQEAVQMHPLAETVSFRGWRSGPAGEALNVQFFGATAEGLKAASEALKTALAPFPEVSAVEDTLSYDKEELILELTPQGQALGFAIDELGRVLRHRLNGLEAATYPEGPRSASIRVELPEGELTADFMERMQLRAPSGVYVPLADIVSVEARAGFSTVRRENGLRVITVTGDISEDDPARAAEVIRAPFDCPCASATISHSARAKGEAGSSTKPRPPAAIQCSPDASRRFAMKSGRAAARKIAGFSASAVNSLGSPSCPISFLARSAQPFANVRLACARGLPSLRQRARRAARSSPRPPRPRSCVSKSNSAASRARPALAPYSTAAAPSGSSGMAARRDPNSVIRPSTSSAPSFSSRFRAEASEASGGGSSQRRWSGSLPHWAILRTSGARSAVTISGGSYGGRPLCPPSSHRR